MDRIKTALDKRRQGTHYADRMHRILGVCQDCGLLWHEERVAFTNGSSALRRVHDIEPVGRVFVTPRYEKYGLHVNTRVLPRLKRMAPQFAYALNVPSTSVEVDGNTVYIRVPLEEAQEDGLLTFEDAWSIAESIPVGSLLLGVDDDRRQLVLEMIAPTNVHAAVVGMTGSGKSTLLKTMILSAQRIGGSQVALFDPSRGLEPLSGHPSVWRGGLFSNAADCERGLEALANQIGRGLGRLTYVFVDEVPDLIAQRPQIKQHLARLAQAGRHAGLHLIIGAQHLLASDVGSMTLRNIPVRLVGRVSDPSAAYQATGRRDTGADSLRGRGDFVAVNGSLTRRFQVAYLSDADLEEWARRYAPRDAMVPVRPEVLKAQTAPVHALAHRATGSGGDGRPPDDIPEEALREIKRYVRQHGRRPSLNWVYRMTKERLPTGGFNRDKARRAIRLAGQAPQQAHAQE